jgi:hypothetical protein
METGIDIRHIPGLIPDIYVISACNAANYCYHTTWLDLTYEQRAEIVAHYLLDKLIESHVHDAQQDEMERQNRKRK